MRTSGLHVVGNKGILVKANILFKYIRQITQHSPLNCAISYKASINPDKSSTFGTFLKSAIRSSLKAEGFSAMYFSSSKKY